MANEIAAVGLLLALMLGGFLVGFNLVETWLGFDLGLGFNDIGGFTSGLWIVIVRVVFIALIGLTGYVIYNIIRG